MTADLERSSGQPTAGRLILMPNALDFGTSAVDTPLDEVLPRSAIRIAAQLDHWVAENAKSARAFLKRVDRVVPLGRPLQSIEIVELPRPLKGRPLARGSIGADGPAGTAGSDRDLETLLAPVRAGHDLGLISEAGLAAVADPGAELVQAAHAAAIQVIALPGPSSPMLALAASGLNGQSFAFVGYLPIENASRAAAIRELEALSARRRQTQLTIETPYRNTALLGALLGHLAPSTRLAVACGLTLPTGFNRSDTVQRWCERPTNLPNDVPAVFAFLAKSLDKPSS